jgi:hypothetical protein
MTGVLFPAGAGILLFLATVSRSALGPIQPPIHWTPRVLSPGVKRPVREVDYWPPSDAEFKNAWTYTSIPQYVFMACCPIKQWTTVPYLNITMLKAVRSLCSRTGRPGLDPQQRPNFFLCLNVHTGSGAHPVSFPVGTGVSFLGGK